MKFLVVNDDGYEATGLKILVEELINYGEVVVYSPKKCESAQAQKITVHKSIKVDKIKLYNIDFNVVHGSAADCVRLGVFDHPDIDLIVSGINQGLNVGQDIYYSSTVAAIIQGGIFNYRGIAMSCDKNYEDIKKQLPTALDEFILNNHKYHNLINVNFPTANYNMYKGIKTTISGKRYFENSFTIKGDYYLETNIMHDDLSHNTDSGEANKGYISVTNLILEKTFI